MLNLDKVFGLHASALELWSKRTEIIANNIANVDTPGYKAKDIDFKAMLNKEISQNNGEMRTTNKSHFNVQPSMSSSWINRPSVQPSLDGNTVDMDTEKAEFTNNMIRYQASYSFLDGKIKSIKTAIRGE